MRFFHVLKSSLYDPVFYAGMKDRSISEGAKYFAVVAFVTVFIYIVPLWAWLLAFDAPMVDRLISVYPDNLEITLANGELHTNQKEPYAIPNTFFEGNPENLAIFDTANDDYAPSTTATSTFVLFKKTFLVARDATRGEQRVIPYSTSTATTTLVKSDVTKIAESVKPYVRPVAITGGAFLFILIVLGGGIGWVVFHLIYILFPALLIFFFSRLAKRGGTYYTAYTTALFASIPVAIFVAIARLFGGLPTFVYTLLLLIVVAINMRKPATPAIES